MNMALSNSWGMNLFKGRIGEAVVESVLAESGYIVIRSGQEFRSGADETGVLEEDSCRPDLQVKDPKTGDVTFVEVKFRAARPMSVILDKARLDAIRNHYPAAILAFVSAYDGSVNCARVSDLNPSNMRPRPGSFYEFDLLRYGWQPIWRFFPLVQPGRRLANHWEEMKMALRQFGAMRVRGAKPGEFFDGEREALIAYIGESWETDMAPYHIDRTNLEDKTLSELWNTARQINAFFLAVDILGEENVGTEEFLFTMFRAMDGVSNHSEITLKVDLKSIRQVLQTDPEKLALFEELVKYAATSGVEAAMNPAQALQEIAALLPSGFGKAFLAADGVSPDEFVEIDLRTAGALSQGRNRLDFIPKAANAIL